MDIEKVLSYEPPPKLRSITTKVTEKDRVLLFRIAHHHKMSIPDLLYSLIITFLDEYRESEEV